MIKINTAQIGPEGLHIDGEEDSAILELESIHGIPVFRCSPIHYDLNATMVGQDLLCHRFGIRRAGNGVRNLS